MRRAPKLPDAGDVGGFIRSVLIEKDKVPSYRRYPFSVPAVRCLSELPLHPRVTFLVGENGSGKSTLIEGIAESAGFNIEGGSKNFNFATREYKSEFGGALRLIRGFKREKDGFFLRAESFFNVATQVEELSRESSPMFLRLYGGKSPHQQSHGESFLALATNRFAGEGLYILDEPEAALSPTRQLSLLQIMHSLAQGGSQFIISTHSPILMAYPDALIYHLSPDGIQPISYEETEHYQITRRFLTDRNSFLHHLFTEVDRETE